MFWYTQNRIVTGELAEEPSTSAGRSARVEGTPTDVAPEEQADAPTTTPKASVEQSTRATGGHLVRAWIRRDTDIRLRRVAEEVTKSESSAEQLARDERTTNDEAVSRPSLRSRCRRGCRPHVDGTAREVGPCGIPLPS